MIIHITQDGDVLEIRLQSPPGMNADYREQVEPGGEWEGIPYEELHQLGTGQHDVDV